MCRLRRSDTILNSHDLEGGWVGGGGGVGAQGEGVEHGKEEGSCPECAV